MSSITVTIFWQKYLSSKNCLEKKVSRQKLASRFYLFFILYRCIIHISHFVQRFSFSVSLKSLLFAISRKRPVHFGHYVIGHIIIMTYPHKSIFQSVSTENIRFSFRSLLIYHWFSLFFARHLPLLCLRRLPHSHLPRLPHSRLSRLSRLIFLTFAFLRVDICSNILSRIWEVCVGWLGHIPSCRIAVSPYDIYGLTTFGKMED